MRTPLDLKSDELAEAMRQSHCDRKTQAHKCVGVMTVSRGQLCLNCELCGDDRHTLENTSALVREAKELCIIMGVDYDALEWQKRRELLLAILDLATHGIC